MTLGAVPKQVGGGPALEVLRVFLGLGLRAFGGPVAHLGYLREEFVVRRRWLAEPSYAELVALCQFLGPAAQVGFAIGCAAPAMPVPCAWLGFTLPSALLMTSFAFVATALNSAAQLGCRTASSPVIVIAQAVFGMARTLCPDVARAGVGCSRLGVSLQLPGLAGQLLVMTAGGAARCAAVPGGRRLALRRRPPQRSPCPGAPAAWHLRSSGLLFALPWLQRQLHSAPPWTLHCLLPPQARWCSAAATWCCRCCVPRSCHRDG